MVEIHAPRMLAQANLVRRSQNRDRDYDFPNVDNFFLLYHRLVPSEALNKDGAKAGFLQSASEHFSELGGQLNSQKNYLKHSRERQQQILAALADAGWQTSQETFTTDWRFITGLGGASVLETSVALHPLYGFPYIPGASVKGIARAYAEEDENMIEADRLRLFGSEDKSQDRPESNQLGDITFFDALPEAWPKLDLDVMTVHYGEYYRDTGSGEQRVPPADWMQPNPIPFLTVAQGVPFVFFLAARQKSVLEQGITCLQNSLTKLGAGAKTNSGYGYFSSEDEIASQQASTHRAHLQSRQRPSGLPKSALLVEIVDVSSKPLRVKLPDSDLIVDMGGIGNPAGLQLQNGSRVYAEPNLERKTRKILSVRFLQKA